MVIINQNHPVLGSNAKESDETHACRNTEIDSRQKQGQNTPNEAKRDVEQHQYRIQRVAEWHKQNQENEYQTNGDDQCQPILGSFLVFKLPVPLHFVAFWQFHSGINLFLSIGNGAAQVAPPNRKLGGDETSVVFAVNKGRPWHVVNTGNLFEWNFPPVQSWH